MVPETYNWKYMCVCKQGGIFLEKRIRKPNRLQGYDYSRDGVYFITICTQNRNPVLSDIVIDSVGEGFPLPHLKQAGNIVQEYFNHLHEKYPMVYVDYFMIMPDHVHVLLRVTNDNEINGTGNPSPTVGNVVGWFKYQTTKEINLISGTTGMRVWQRSYYDHVIRCDEDYWHIRQYIEENPIRWIEKMSGRGDPAPTVWE